MDGDEWTAIADTSKHHASYVNPIEESPPQTYLSPINSPQRRRSSSFDAPAIDEPLRRRMQFSRRFRR